MVNVVDYKPEHLAQIELKSCHHGEVATEIQGQAITLLDGEYPAAIIGWHFITPGVLLAWGLFSERIRRQPLSFHKMVLKLIEFSKTQNVHRIQISVLCGFTEGWKWAEALGFKCEGIMKKYGNDQADYWLFARTT